jgi:hypothetical protein
MTNKRLMLLMLLGFFAFASPAMANGTPDSQAKIVSRMEEQAESLVDSLLKKDQAESEHHYEMLRSNLNRLHALLEHKNFNERSTRELFTAYSWMHLISIDLREHTWIGAAIAANQMRGETIRFTDFANLTLRDVAWMDYLSREVMLLSMEDMQGNRQMIDLRRNDLHDTWERVREDMIKDFRNKSLVMRGDHLIAGMQQATGRNQLIALARQELDFVDAVEKALGAG